MPRPASPPTPMASTEIQSKDASTLSATDKSFNLGSPAMAPKHTNGEGRQSKQPQNTLSTKFTLPPPPTRSRTIIQMKPKAQSSEGATKAPTQCSPRGTSKRNTGASTSINGGSKKQPSSTSVAGKKIARKTAHSVIERRRRSKMNEEFATLKGMIPACTDQEMHKLAILQASIDYLHYLQNCIVDLRAANDTLSTPLMQPQAPLPRQDITMLDDDDSEDEEDDNDNDNEDGDAIMGAEISGGTRSSVLPATQSHGPSYSSPQSSTTSPTLNAQFQHRTSSYASWVSTLPSPAFQSRGYDHRGSQPYSSLSSSNSPNILPDKEQDQEAMAALLMLNKDRRNPKEGRGLSVKDLLSS